MDNILVELSNNDNKFIISNMYPFYLYDLGEIRNILPNKYGVFEDDDSIKTLEEQRPLFDVWWKKEDVLFPYLITVDGIAAGFILVTSPPYVAGDSDFMVGEMFIMRQFRGKGIGEEAIKTIFNKHIGSWMLFTTLNERNSKTIGFWRKTLSKYTKDQFIEEDKDIPEYEFGKVFSFSNK